MENDENLRQREGNTSNTALLKTKSLEIRDGGPWKMDTEPSRGELRTK